jgi:hypothetical protein
MGLATSRLAGATALAAAISMAATPVAAADFQSPSTHSKAGITAYGDYSTANYDRWRGRHRDRGIDAGDVLAGVLILGGIAAIASAASNSNKQRERDQREQRRYEEPYPENDDRPVWQGDHQRPSSSSGSSSSYTSGGIDNAVAMCSDQVERGPDRIDSVDNAARTTDGWRISGRLQQGGAFSCWIDNDGRIREIDLDSSRNYSGASYDTQYDGDYSGASTDTQYDDDYYARARANLDAQAEYDQIDGDLGG